MGFGEAAWRRAAWPGRRAALTALAAAAPVAAAVMRQPALVVMVALLSAATAWRLSRPGGPAPSDDAARSDAFLAQAQARLDGAAPGRCALAVICVDDVDKLADAGLGDSRETLAVIAGRLAESLGPQGLMLSSPGGVFSLVLDGGAGRDALRVEIDRLVTGLGREIRRGGTGFTPELRAGVAVCTGEGERAQALLRRAARAAQAAETAGERVVFYSREQRTADLQRFALKQELRAAVEQGALALHYQPIVDVRAGRIVGAEALLRWRRPDGTSVAPAHFVPLLEESALVEEVGFWLLHVACRQLKLWLEAGVGELGVAVNLSARQFRDPRLHEVIGDILQLHGVAPSTLEVELTETTATQDVERTRSVLAQLRTLGVRAAIDDFGSGYSSMSYLRTLPFSRLKIDREFVVDVDTRPESRAICQAVIDLARSLGMSVLAEGVERGEEVQVLLDLGCSVFQGYYFSEPLDPAAFQARATDPAWLAWLGGVRGGLGSPAASGGEISAKARSSGWAPASAPPS